MTRRAPHRTPQKPSENLLVSQEMSALASATGERFFQALVATIAKRLGMQYVLVARRSSQDPHLAETVAFFAHGSLVPNVTYPMAGTPCEAVQGGATCSYPRGVVQAFPDDPLLVEMGVESYVGVPLFDGDGQSLGYLAVLGTNVLEDPEGMLAILSAFAARTAGELERRVAEDAQRLRETRLQLQNTMLVELARSPAVARGDRDAFLHEITEAIVRTLNLERAMVWLFDEEPTELFVADMYDTASHRHRSGMRLSLRDCSAYLQALETSRFVDVGDALNDPQVTELVESYFKPMGVRATLDAPFRIDGRLVGVICSEMISGPRVWRTDEKLFAASVADIASLGLEAIELRAAQREVRSRNRVLAALQRVSETSLRARTLEEALDQIVEQIADLTGYPAVWLQLVTPNGAENRLVAGHGLLDESGSPHVPLASFPCDRVISGGEIVVRDAAARAAGDPPGLFLGLPLVQEQRVLGALCLWDPEASIADIEAIGLLRGLAASIAGLVERSRSREQAEELKERLRQSQKLEAIGTLAGGVAHDFNNLLTGILGYTWLLKQNAQPEDEVYRSASVIENAAERAAELTRQLLGFARQGQHQDLPVDLNALVSEVTELLSRTFDKAVTLHVAPHPRNLRVLGDPGQLHQVLLNLAINARDAMPRGGDLYFDVRALADELVPRAAHPHLGRGAHAVLEVRDTGTGMRPIDQRRIFEPFFTTKEVGKGSGMGLALVYGIVQGHRGAIEVESREHVGTVFRVYLPLLEGAAAGATGGERRAVEAELPVPGQGLVLVVDDEELVREMARELLTSLGYQVLTARNGLEAIDRFIERRSEIDLVVLDLVMPRMGGRECLRALKRIDPQVRVLLSSGWQREGHLQSAMEEGALGFLSKPYQLVALSQAVARAIQA
jgi:signal transduction histidine kinase/ActR/RegA family two-component response regulator